MSHLSLGFNVDRNVENNETLEVGERSQFNLVLGDRMGTGFLNLQYVGLPIGVDCGTSHLSVSLIIKPLKV